MGTSQTIRFLTFANKNIPYVRGRHYNCVVIKFDPPWDAGRSYPKTSGPLISNTSVRSVVPLSSQGAKRRGDLHIRILEPNANRMSFGATKRNTSCIWQIRVLLLWRV